MTELGTRYDPVDKPPETPKSTAEMGGYVPEDRPGDPPEVTRASWVADGTLYAPGHSHYFRDLLLEHEARARAAASLDNPTLRGHDPGPDEPPSFAISESGGIAGARERLTALRERGQRQLVEARRARRQEEARRIAAGEQRDMSSTDGSGGQFVPSAESAPAHIASQFALAARDRGVLPSVLPNVTLPSSGLAVSAPRFTSGASTALHSENTSVSETDPATGLAQSAVVTISGQVDVSREALERSEPGLDDAISAELGRAYAESLDQEVVTGDGTSGRLTGLLNAAATEVTWTQSTPTQAQGWAKIQQALAETGTAYGMPVRTVLAHTRRVPWLYADPSLSPQLPGDTQFVPVPTIPVNLGGGNDEDRVVVLDPPASPLATSPVRFLVHESVGSDTATVRLQVYGYVALLSERQPSSIGKVTGSGLAGVSWSA